MSQIVYFFDEPTIGYCPQCEEVAIYTDKLVCPWESSLKGESHELAFFTWSSGAEPE